MFSGLGIYKSAVLPVIVVMNMPDDMQVLVEVSFSLDDEGYEVAAVWGTIRCLGSVTLR